MPSLRTRTRPPNSGFPAHPRQAIGRLQSLERTLRSPLRAAGSDPGGPGRVGPGRSGSRWPGSGQRSAGSGSSFRDGVARRSGNWRNGASGSGRRFTGITSGSGNIWRKIAEGCWGASGYGGSWAAECERSAGRSGDKRKCWDASGRSWRTGYAGSGFRWGIFRFQIPGHDEILDRSACSVVWVEWDQRIGSEIDHCGRAPEHSKGLHCVVLQPPLLYHDLCRIQRVDISATSELEHRHNRQRFRCFRDFRGCRSCPHCRSCRTHRSSLTYTGWRG